MKAEIGLDDSAGIEAAQGSCFHHFADLCLDCGLDPFGFVGAIYNDRDHGDIQFTEEMAEGMLEGLDYLRAYADRPGSQLFVERQVDISRWAGEGQFGISDASLVDVENRFLMIFDWKWGFHAVSPIENDQAILYALGVWNDIAEGSFEGVHPKYIDVRIVIEQPRAPGGGGVWDTTMARLLKIGKSIREDADACDEPDAPRISGPVQCKWCPAAKFRTCREYVEDQIRAFGLKLDQLDQLAEEDEPPPMPDLITPQRRAYLLKHRPVFSAFMDGLHKDSYNAARKGKPDPGLKLVKGRAPARKWSDDEKMELVLEEQYGDDAFNRVLKSPTQVESMIGKKPFALAHKNHLADQEPLPALVDINDKRPALKSSLDKLDELDFEDLI